MAEEQIHDQSVHVDEHDPHSSKKTPMPSSRSHFQSEIGEDPDQALINQYVYLLLYPNNHHVDFDSLNVNPLVVEILKGHPLHHALIDSVAVPLIYLQQVWKTIKYVVESDTNKYFKLRIDNFTSILTYQRLRGILDLPEANSREGRTRFDQYPVDSEIFAGILALGYTGSLTKISDFKKANLPPFYYQMFSVFNRCFTSRNSGLDITNMHTLRLFHAVVYDLHVDYSVVFWMELYEKLISKRTSKSPIYVPYQRFLQLIIRCMIRSNRDIPKITQHELAPKFVMKYLQKAEKAVHLLHSSSTSFALICQSEL
ncbi:hypothetical protein L6452_01837 [Arctium lappa]|uniref:Uncharacterized protein n=1 Tax=Arctium lappa TaxID=4217 RepID=A0ACB9FJ19_ARCLA|nr:hypothetical protein L6452_01837 [Arctium lappa]